MRNFAAKIGNHFLDFVFDLLVPVAVIGMVFLLVYAWASGPTLDKQAQMLQPSVQINNNCSATVLSSSKPYGTILLTAYHCVDNKRQGNINYTTDVLGESKTVDIAYNTVASDSVNDIALIHTFAYGFKTAQLATQKPAEGQEAWTVGYPLGLPRQLSTGFYGLNMLVGGMDHQRASNFIAGGNSGGGLFVIEDGEYKLVGVTSKGMLSSMIPSMFTPIGLYSELKPIHDLLEECTNCERP